MITTGGLLPHSSPVQEEDLELPLADATIREGFSAGEGVGVGVFTDSTALGQPETNVIWIIAHTESHDSLEQSWWQKPKKN